MGQDSAIEWCHHTFNPWWGCTKVSPGCFRCYAETLSRRYGFDIWGKGQARRSFGDKHWIEPLRWNGAAQRLGERRRVFCASMADVFEDHPQLPEWRARLWDLIEQTPALDWLVLTKRPENIPAMIPEAWRVSPKPNVWYGTSVENQRCANERLPLLLQVPAVIRFLSCEPLLEPVNIDLAVRSRLLHWVIVGGESGPKARPMHPDWARLLRDQCQAEGVAFFFKQWGEWVGLDQVDYIEPGDWDRRQFVFHDGPRMTTTLHRLGRKNAGRLLDGREWSEYPGQQEVRS